MSFIKLKGQTTISELIKDIDTKNPDLIALKKNIEAQKLNIKNQNLLENPEMAYGHYPGSPSSLGVKKVFSAQQNFDFPTVYSSRKKLGKLQSQQLDYYYLQQRNELVGEVLNTMVEIIYLNQTLKVLSERFEHAENLFRSYQNKLKQGAVNLPEFNKTKLKLADYKNRLRKKQAERERQLQRIAYLLNQKEMQINDTVYPVFVDREKASILDSIYAKYNSLKIYEQNKHISDANYKLARNNALPNISTGFEREVIENDKFTGFAIGISIPIWGTGRKIKQAKINQHAAELEYEAAKQSITNKINADYNFMLTLKSNMKEYQNALTNNNIEMLNKSLELGNISIVDFLSELEFYYEFEDLHIEAEKEYFQALANLMKYLY